MHMNNKVFNLAYNIYIIFYENIGTVINKYV